MKHLIPILLGFVCSIAVSQAQSNFHSAMPVAGDHTGSLHWTMGEVFSGPLPDATGASLTMGFIQPMVAVATDLQPRLEEAVVTAFPIPARDYLTVQFGEISDWTLYLMDLSGRTLASWQVHTAKTEIPLADFRPGVYVLRVVNTDWHSQVIRFLKH